MVKEPGYTYSSPNTLWINVAHKYNRGSIIQYKDTRKAAYFIMRGSAIIWKLLPDIQTITKKRYRKKDHKFI